MPNPSNPLHTLNIQPSSWATFGTSPSAQAFDEITALQNSPLMSMAKKAMPKDSEKFYNRPVPGAYKKVAGDIGLEIEVEGKNLFNTPFKYWACHQDNSLRDTDGHPAVEYVLRSPMSYSEVERALDYLETKLQEVGSSIVESTRTSVHVHINCQSYTLRQIYCYILLYIIFEEMLVDWAGPTRVGNLHCLRAKDSEYFIQMLEGVLRKQDYGFWKEDMRYTACNVASLRKFGSLEFRALRGTVDSSLILFWVRILLMLRDQALKYDNPQEILEDFYQLGPLPFFKKIFHIPDIREAFSDTPHLSQKMWDGARLMRDVAFSCEWEKPLPKKSLQKEEASEVSRVKAGQWVTSPWDSEARSLVRYYYNADSNTVEPVQVFTDTTSPAIYLPVQPNWTLYYVNHPFSNTRIYIELREGEPEFAS